MLDRLIPLKRVMRKPWEMCYIGLLYSSVAIILTNFIFSKDYVLSQYSGILLVLFTLICCLPYMYRIIKQEEGNDLQINEQGKLIREHAQAIKALMWLFLGLVIGFSFWYLVLPESAATNFDAQIKTFCVINSPHNYDACLQQYGLITGAATKMNHLMAIFANNLYVMIFTLVFSLVLGAGAIFILIWNASVIAAAIGMFAGNLGRIHLGFLRYLVHGLPEISAYFVAALAGGIVSVAFIRKDLKGERLWIILQDAIILVIVALLILIASAFLEVYFTPLLIR
jgi:uncharacterized membrane protein SpoIIM required for sporulation